MKKALFRTFFARGVASLGSLILVVVLGRLYGAEGLGVFALAQSLILGAGIIARFGMNNSLMRVVGHDDQSSSILQYLKWAFGVASLASLFFLFVIFMTKDWLESTFDAPGLSGILVGFSISLPAFVFSFVLSGFFKGIKSPAVASLLENGVVSLLAAFLIIAFHILEVGGLDQVGVAFALSSWVVFLLAFFYFYLWLRKQNWFGSKKKINVDFTRREFYSISSSFFIMSVANLMQSTISIVIAGWFLSKYDLGLYKSSQQMAIIISFVLIVVNIVFPPYFSRLYKEGNVRKLETFVKKSTLWAAALALPITVVAIVIPDFVMSVFGKEFSDAGSLLRIIAIAQFFNVMTGPVGFLLGMTGHDKVVRNISVASNIAALILFLTMIPWLGVLGAALSLAFVLVVQNALCVFYVWVNLGVWSLPTPNLMKAVGVKVKGDFSHGNAQ